MVLPLLKTDLLTIFEAVADEKLADLTIEWADGSAACVMMASGGYPQKYESGKVIEGLDENGQSAYATVYHSGTKLSDGTYLTAGGRVLGVAATGANLMKALGKAYAAVETITFEGAHYRKDIGSKALHSI